jgi:hypothetical protein
MGSFGVYMGFMDLMVFRPIIVEAIMLFMTMEAALRCTSPPTMTLEWFGLLVLSLR